jgi:GNAT superfamily N-acetyltransferase
MDSDIPDVIAFCDEYGFTKRTREDWIGGGLEAALAFKDHEIVGAFPFYKRQVVTNDGSTVTCGHFTAVAIHHEHRNAGLGSKLLSTLYESFDIAGMLVNSNEDDRAYKWYARNGYELLNNITVLSTSSRRLSNSRKQYFIREITASRIKDEESINLKQVFDKYVSGYAGFEARELNFWNLKLSYHYYRSYNRYFLVTDREEGFSFYAIAAISSYPGREISIDILEWAYHSAVSMTVIIAALAELAVSNNVMSVRIAIDNSSPIQSFLLDNGFVSDWSFDILYHNISCSPDRLKPCRYFHFDYA